MRANDATGTTSGTPVAVDTTGNVGMSTSMKIVADRPAISYHDTTNSDLKYVRAGNTTGSIWNTPVIVDASSGSVSNTSLEVVNGNPAIAYGGSEAQFFRSSDSVGSVWATPVTGTIGQPDAHAASAGGVYAVSGGFFSQYIALQQAGVPRLVIRRVGPNVHVVWAASVPGWVLQLDTADLAAGAWSDVAGAPTVSGIEQYHEFIPGGGMALYRLKKL